MERRKPLAKFITAFLYFGFIFHVSLMSLPWQYALKISKAIEVAKASAKMCQDGTAFGEAETCVATDYCIRCNIINPAKVNNTDEECGKCQNEPSLSIYEEEKVGWGRKEDNIIFHNFNFLPKNPDEFEFRSLSASTFELVRDIMDYSFGLMRKDKEAKLDENENGPKKEKIPNIFGANKYDLVLQFFEIFEMVSLTFYSIFTIIDIIFAKWERDARIMFEENQRYRRRRG